jgi:AraC family transcriptional regulator
MSELSIKNMVCPRCIQSVETLLNNQGIPFNSVGLGYVSLPSPLSQEEYLTLERQIKTLGFEILKTKEVQKIEKIKNILLQLLLDGDIPPSLVLSHYITQFIPEDYTNLSNLFSSLQGITIEKYFIHLKIEKVKEYLFYQEMNVSEIAMQLGYSSVQHLSSQFKKVTGMTPSQYKNLQHKPRKSLDILGH